MRFFREPAIIRSTLVLTILSECHEAVAFGLGLDDAIDEAIAEKIKNDPDFANTYMLTLASLTLLLGILYYLAPRVVEQAPALARGAAP